MAFDFYLTASKIHDLHFVESLIASQVFEFHTRCGIDNVTFVKSVKKLLIDVFHQD